MSLTLCINDIDPADQPQISCERNGCGTPTIWIRWGKGSYFRDAIALTFENGKLDHLRAAVDEANAMLAAQAAKAAA